MNLRDAEKKMQIDRDETKKDMVDAFAEARYELLNASAPDHAIAAFDGHSKNVLSSVDSVFSSMLRVGEILIKYAPEQA